jgi:D-arabinose 1-dehydrogenase-like Zn-dependent alcohol dehydrogenase/uncharacterized protein (UPF0276 family)
MPTDDWLVANRPLFDAGLVDVVEWSLDFGWGGTPAAVTQLLDDYERRGALLAHGVEGSLLTVDETEEQRVWRASVLASSRERKYLHLTEHYGFITAASISRGTPFSLPPSRSALRLAIERFLRLRDDTGLPIGVENLAFAFSADDARAQADFVSELVLAVDGFLLLDLHNLHCQSENFDLDALDLASLYPLDRARELHVAGGSVLAHRRGTRRSGFRRDTHDTPTPEAVHHLVQQVVSHCPSLRFVILERTDRSLFSAEEAARHRDDYASLRAVVAAAVRGSARSSPPPRAGIAWVDDTDAELRSFQGSLLHALRGCSSATELSQRLAAHSLYQGWVRSFDESAAVAALHMARQWTIPDVGAGEMIAAVFRSPDWPLDFVALPVPRPEAGQVLVRTAAVGLCGTDAHILRGRFDVPTPVVLGHETVGEVVALGEGVEDLRVGDRVGVSWVQAVCGACSGCKRWGSAHPSRCAEPRTWMENGGGLSELFVAEASGCTRIPDALGFVSAAPLFCAGHVAVSAFRAAAASPHGGATARVGVLGTGGIGRYVAQLASARGHPTTLVTSRRSKVGELPTAAAPVPILPLDAIRPRSFDVVVATSSDTSTLGAATEWLELGGRLVVVALGSRCEVEPALIVANELTITGVTQGSHADLEEALSLAATGVLRAEVEEFPFSLVQRALERLVAGRVGGRAVVTF